MPIATAIIASAVIGAGASAVSASEQNRRAASNQASQQQFEEDMSGTAYQRATKDMIAAGLNPMLAYKLGGASTPQVGQAPVVAPLGNAPDELARLPERIANVQLSSAQAANQRAQEWNTVAGVDKVIADTKKTNAEAVAQEYENRENLGLRTDKLRSEVEAADYEAGIRGKEEAHAEDYFFGRASEAYGKGKSAMAQSEYAPEMARADLRSRHLQNILDSLKVPGATAQAEHDKSFAGKARPYLDDIGRLLHGANQARRLGQ